MVLCFGELLLRLAPDEAGGWIDKNSLNVYVGGAELNVAKALGKWNIPVKYCTALPENFLSKKIIDNLKKKNIDISTIFLEGKRIGLYYLLKGSSIQHTEIIYDRNYSSFYELKPGKINWDRALKDVTWFHFSAITPALNENVAAICKGALQFCNEKNITVSIDLNYRPKLWQYGKQPNEIMPSLLEHCDVVMGNIWSIEKMLDINLPNTFSENKQESFIQQSQKTSEEIIKRFPKCKIVANTFRFEKEELEYYATIFSDGFFCSKVYRTNSMIDKVGSGDAFMAGLIYGIKNKMTTQETIDFAASAAFQKLFVEGDCLEKSIEEIKSFLKKYE